MNVLARKGYSAEHFVVADLIEKDFTPCLPTIPSSEFDILAVRDNRRYKIQVKSGEFDGNKMKVDLRKSKGTDTRNYQKSEVDYFAIFDRVNKEVAYLPAKTFLGKTQVTLYRNKPEKLCGFYGDARKNITVFSQVSSL